MHEAFFKFLPLFALYVLSRCDLFNMSCLSLISLMGSLDILCFNSFNLKNKIVKIERKKIFGGPSKVLKNISWPPQKPSGPPSYILNVQSLMAECLVHL